MQKKTMSFILFILITGMCIHSAIAGSYYNSKGLGGKRYISNAQAIGLGGAMISLQDSRMINTLNPAALVNIHYTRLSGDFLHEALWSETNSAEGFSKYTNLNGVSIAIPLIQDKLATSFYIMPISQFDYDYNVPGEIDDLSYSKNISATGGLNKLAFGFGYAPIPKLSVGAYMNYNFGKLEQTWKVDYVSDLFWDSTDKLTRKMWGVNWSFGFIANPTPKLHIGGVYSSKYTLSLEDEITNYTIKGSTGNNIDTYRNDDGEMDIPEFWGLGATYLLTNKYRVSLDYLYQPWSNFHVDNQLTQQYQNSYRIGGGIERLPDENILATYLQKLTYRIGYFYQSLDFLDEQNNSVSEYGVSMGLGLPYYNRIGRIDIAFRYGQRGDLSQNTVKENIFQFFISVTGGEKWFYRPK